MARSQENPWQPPDPPSDQPQTSASPPPKPKVPGFQDFPDIHSGDNFSIGDAVNYSANASNDYLKDFGGLQDTVASLWKQVLAGDIPGAVTPLIAGRLSATRAAIPQAQRLATDTMAPGGKLQETLANIPQQMVAQQAQGTQDILGPLQSGAIDAGSNVMMRAIAPLMQAAQIRVGQKAAENGGGKK